MIKKSNLKVLRIKGGIKVIISDTTIRKIIVDNKEQVLDIVSKGIDDYLVDINKHGNIYEINLVSKVGDYNKK